MEYGNHRQHAITTSQPRRARTPEEAADFIIVAISCATMVGLIVAVVLGY